MKKARIILVLIFLIAVIGIAWYAVNQYMPSRETMDPAEYFGVTGGTDAALILDNEMVSGKAVVVDGVAYLELGTVQETFSDRFYQDDAENQIIFTTATNILKIPYNSETYDTLHGSVTRSFPIVVTEGTQVYLALDFIEQYAPLTYTVREQPFRIILSTEESIRSAKVIKETNVRSQADVKSPILTTLTTGDVVTVLQEEDDWTRVLTSDGFIGCLRTQTLDTPYEEEILPREEESASVSQRKDYRINLVWHQVTTADANELFEEEMQDVTGVNTVSPTWFSIASNDGTITSLSDDAYVTAAHEKGLEVWALLDNFNESVNTTAVLADTTSRETLEDALIREAISHRLDGINIDIESLTAEASSGYVQFLRELSVKCKSNALVLSVDVPPPYEYNAHYSYAALAEAADYVIVMGYDEHYVGSQPGSVASLPYETEAVTGLLASVPAEQIILGVPFYTRLWKTSPSGEVSSSAIGMDAAQDILDQYDVTPNWSTDTSQFYAEFTDEDGSFCQIWLEEETSLTEKVNLVSKYALGGTAAWKLGFERPSVWTILDPASSN